jgi:hypothetical protein
MPNLRLAQEQIKAAWQGSGVDQPTRLAISGTAKHFRADHAVGNRSRLESLFGVADVQQALSLYTDPSAWCKLRNADQLHISVIGVSVTAGCGGMAMHGEDLTPTPRHRGRKGRGPSRPQCLAQLGWTRRLANSYEAQAGAATPRRTPFVDWSIWPKNAAPLRFWLQCTEASFDLSSKTSIVLIETEPTLTVADGRELVQLVAQLRRSAPNAVLCFVMWPSQRQREDRAVEDMVRQAASRGAFDVITVSKLLDAAGRVGVPAETFYSDPVHPNADGHAVLAGMTSIWLHMQLRSASTQPPCDRDARYEEPHPMSVNLPRATFERCYSRADAIPIVPKPPPSWRLLNDGADKGVLKLGYVSTTPGETLLIGPVLPEVRCGLFDVSIGYLVSWRPEQGAIHVTCTGSCACVAMHQYRWSRAHDHDPFPELQTWTHAHTSSVHATLANASTTSYSRFLLAKRDYEAASTSDCIIHVEHRRRSDSLPVDVPSRVRLDGLSLKLSSCAAQCVAARHTGPGLNRTRFDELISHCSKGARFGQDGYLSPSCGHASKSCVDSPQGDD